MLPYTSATSPVKPLATSLALVTLALDYGTCVRLARLHAKQENGGNSSPLPQMARDEALR